MGAKKEREGRLLGAPLYTVMAAAAEERMITALGLPQSAEVAGVVTGAATLDLSLRKICEGAAESKGAKQSQSQTQNQTQTQQYKFGQSVSRLEERFAGGTGGAGQSLGDGGRLAKVVAISKVRVYPIKGRPVRCAEYKEGVGNGHAQQQQQQQQPPLAQLHCHRSLKAAADKRGG
ncbi:hypothetical protein BX661DRAFT_198803 [Kickxella alabastrina]|uniref:uncharacterized protein n=1 Tax=Kickxella alabastrina TaxID=61397 RepID=UPI00221E9C8E|nr:uncharacterized protein BX661DRAFT_198803 [Kickxella alabastrina]KAI7826789.1 hypothetical protein BX661DRAFT_198803 [Kickxella alabastrina]